jgi:hypothetical protein
VITRLEPGGNSPGHDVGRLWILHPETDDVVWCSVSNMAEQARKTAMVKAHTITLAAFRAWLAQQPYPYGAGNDDEDEC